LRKCVVLRISIGLKICCIGIRGTAEESSSASHKLSSSNHHHPRLTEKIGQPLITMADALPPSCGDCNFCKMEVTTIHEQVLKLLLLALTYSCETYCTTSKQNILISAMSILKKQGYKFVKPTLLLSSMSHPMMR
jgi:hypothetical protein